MHDSPRSTGYRLALCIPRRNECSRADIWLRAFTISTLVSGVDPCLTRIHHPATSQAVSKGVLVVRGPVPTNGLQLLRVLLVECLVLSETSFPSIPPALFTPLHQKFTRCVRTDQDLRIPVFDWTDPPRSLAISSPPLDNKSSNSASLGRSNASFTILPHHLGPPSLPGARPGPGFIIILTKSIIHTVRTSHLIATPHMAPSHHPTHSPPCAIQPNLCI